MGADAEADEGLLAQAKDNDKISGYLGRWKAYLPLSIVGRDLPYVQAVHGGHHLVLRCKTVL